MRADRFGSVATSPSRTVEGAYWVLLPDAAAPGAPGVGERVAVGLEHLALDWLDADAAPGEARPAGRQQRLVEQTADGELVARLLAEPGTDPNTAVDNTESNGEACTNYNQLAHAVELGHLEAVRLLLDAGADPSHAGSDGTTPLMSAAWRGHLEVLQLLLGRGAALDPVHPEAGWTAFHMACYDNQADCAEALVRVGFDVGTKDKHGRTGLKVAEARAHAGMLVRLRAVISEQLWAAQATALAGKLLVSAMEGDAAAVSRLLAAGADPNASVPARKPSGEVFNSTALGAAAHHGRLEAARLLLDGGANPSLADSYGVTPLMAVAEAGQLEVLRLLLAKGVAVDAAQPADGWTAFHCACWNNRVECVEALARAGCDVGLNTKTGFTGREVAEGSGHAAVLARLQAVVESGGGGGGGGRTGGGKKKRKKRPKKKQTVNQVPGTEPEPEPERQPQPQPQPAPDRLLAGLGLSEHLTVCHEHKVDLGARLRPAFSVAAFSLLPTASGGAVD